jgi:predicted phage tail protein
MFRGIALWDGLRLSVMLDAPQDPIATITNANVVNGEFKRSSVKRSEKYNAVVVSWTDPDNGWEQVKEYVSDDEMIAKGNYNETTLEAFGCTSRGQAWRAGKWLLKQQSVKAADCLSRWLVMLSTSRRVISLRSWTMTTQELASGGELFLIPGGP